MKNLLLLICVAALVALTGTDAKAEQVKLKYIGSIYTDADGVPLNNPAGVAIAGNTLLVADSGGKRILSFRLENGEVKPDRSLPVPDMFPLMVQKDADDNIYVLDGRARQIVILDKAGRILKKLEAKQVPGNGTVIPRSFKMTADGSLWILDIFSERALKVGLDGQYQASIPFPDSYGSFADIAIDRMGAVYLLDSVAGAIYKAAPGADSFSPWNTSLKEYTNFPTSLDLSPQGSLFLADKHGSGLAILAQDGSFSGRRLSMGWSDGQLYYPNQISIDDEGRVFIADTKNHRIQQFNIDQ